MKPIKNITSVRKGMGINPSKEPLTLEKLKTYEGFEDLTDEEAQVYLFEIKTLAALILAYQKQLAPPHNSEGDTEPLKQAA